jgi:hypothetical protein
MADRERSARTYELRQLARRLPRRVHMSAASNTKKTMIKIVMVMCPPKS